MSLKEKVKRYIQSNYGTCSIAHVAKRFGTPVDEVEDYFLEELSPKTVIAEKQASFDQPGKDSRAKLMASANKVTITLLLLCLVALVFALNISQMSNNDIWMHMKNGELILKGRHFLYTDTYSFRTIGKEWVNHEWLAGVIFFLVNKIYPVSALIFFKGFLVLILALFLVATCRLTYNRWTILYTITVFALFNAGVRFLVRPHMFTYFFTPIYLYILFAYKYRKKDYLFWLPILTLLWVNIHGGFVIGIGIMSLFTFGETFRTLINRYFSYWQNDILSLPRLKKLWAIWLISGIVLSFNPHGLSIYTYPFELTSQKVFMSQIYEWQPPFKSSTFMRSYAFTYFLIWLVLLGLSFLLDWKHFDLTNALVCALFVAMAFKMHRNIADFALATAPVMSLNFDLFFDRFSNHHGRAEIDLLLKLAILVITVGLTAMSFKYGYIYREGSRKPFGLGVASNMPIEAVQYIKENNIKGNCFNPYTYGTYIIYHLYPETRVVMDSRDLPHGEELYLEHQYAMNRVDVFKAMFQKYHIDYILLNYRNQDLAKHFEYLEESGDWVLVYFDDRNVVYIRNLPENKELIERDGYFVLHPVLTVTRGGVETKSIPRCMRECKRSIERNPRLAFPRVVLQNIYAAQGNFEQAIMEGEELVQLEPSNVHFHILLGETYKKAGKLEQAAEHGRRVTEIDPQNPRGYIFLGELFKEMGHMEEAKDNYLKVMEIRPDLEQRVQGKLDELRTNHE
ncbi:MAG: tetratricopeptide repeat protein [bacterium]